MNQLYFGVPLPVAIVIAGLFYALPVYLIIKGVRAIRSEKFYDQLPRQIYAPGGGWPLIMRYTGSKAKKMGITYLVTGVILAILLFFFLSNVTG